MYKVVKSFTDLQDDKYPYAAGDIFPRSGLEVSQERIKELASASNKRKTPLIELVEEDFMNPPETPTAPVKTENRPKKRGRKKNAD